MNFQRIFLGLAVLLACGGVSVASAMEPKNLEVAKQEVMRYHDSHEYDKDLARVVEQAKAYLKMRVAKNKAKHSSQKLAIVFDIDETALSNYPELVHLHFGGTNEDFEQMLGKGNDAAIQPSLELYQLAKANGVAVFFITSRRENFRAVTEANLQKAGFDKYEGLYFMPMDYQARSVAPYKIGVRKEIAGKGYVIVVNVGDQKSDLKGGVAEKAFKLPDPYYFIP